MAAHSKQSKCGSCNKNVAKNSKALLCAGNCDSWHHITCINISNEEYELIKTLKGKLLYICDRCRLPATAEVSLCCSVNEKIANDDNGLTNPEHLKLLTDQIFNLSENYKNLSLQFVSLQGENVNLKSALNAQAEVISDMIQNRYDKDFKSYADALKVKSVDPQKVEQMQHRLFSVSSSAENLGLDTFSLDIQRGRDHGLPSYNTFRAKCGIRRARDFGDLADTIPLATIMSLRMLYKNVNDIDLLVGGMSEYTVEGLLGPVFKCIIAEQFKRTRVGDRFFYDNAYVPGAFTENQLKEIKKSTLARIFCDNTNNVLTMQPYVFYKPVTP
ncbi:hypothetical protein J6590_045867, partial [Homalodisca vitripennis]